MKTESPVKSIKRLQLIIEKQDGKLWGRVKVRANLIVDFANNLQALKKQISKLAFDFEQIKVGEFDVNYDLISFFEAHNYLNIGDVANRANINHSLMRQYAAGLKFPSENRVKQIEDAIREIGKELSKVKLHKPQRELA